MKELRKRLEEAARKSFEERYPDGIDLYKEAQIDGFIAGAEFGYKEGMALVKEWIERELFNDIYWGRDDEGSFLDADELLSDLETDMNKLWED